MMRTCWIGVVLVCCVGLNHVSAQSGPSDLKLFGYFQTSAQYDRSITEKETTTSFSMQQLNVFMQKDLARRWTSLINFEVLNNFSSLRNWGAFNLEEAWVRYRSSRQFNVKVGLHIPPFNALNEIKNRMPLLPYIIRPLIYETSLEEVITLEEFAPQRAFFQVYGILPGDKLKLDYAAYLGNSPNIRSVGMGEGTTGVDTTAYMLVGGRLGIRLNEFDNELRLGASVTHDRTNRLVGAETIVGGAVDRFEGRPRWRTGLDFSYRPGRFSIEAEYVFTDYDFGDDRINADSEFYYATLGYDITEELFIYLSYWFTRQYGTTTVLHFGTAETEDELITGYQDIEVPTVGVSYLFSDTINVKAQYAYGRILPSRAVQGTVGFAKNEFHNASLAISVVF